MTLSAEERTALAQRSNLSDSEAFVVSSTLDHMRSNASLLNVFLANDDRCAKLEAAVIRYVIDSRPSIPTVPVEYKTANYTIHYDPATLRGDFEHNTRGEYSAGMLIFEAMEAEPGKVELIDYDGVTQLPKEVKECLKNQGFNLDDIDTDAP